ncbi:hypothetical protein ABW19_dt0205452 [Dactylella cylindrospora]|nr:hypothetical protein ABW19_dt0205452 [Dactylella cylindrospora]
MQCYFAHHGSHFYRKKSQSDKPRSSIPPLYFKRSFAFERKGSLLQSPQFFRAGRNIRQDILAMSSRGSSPGSFITTSERQNKTRQMHTEYTNFLSKCLDCYF